jgi:hypothetical protein
MIERDRELLQRVQAAGISLTVDGARLRYRAPAGAITPELRADLQELKPTLLYEYHERAAIMEFDGGLARPEAERLAAEEVLNNGTPDTGRKIETR